MPTPSVAVIVLNYRGERVLARCLDSLEKALGPSDRVLIVDNGHEEVLLNALCQRYPRVETIRSEANVGFAAGMNLGIQHVLEHGQFDAFWLMNNDAYIEPDALSQMKQALIEKGDQSLFSPVIYPNEGTLPWFSGGQINFFRMRTTHMRALRSQSACFSTDFLTGCAIFIPRAVITALGFLDERYFLYYEDAAYSLRARRMGLRLWVVPRAKIFHSEESEQNPEKLYWLVRSGVEFFFRESRGLWRLWVGILFILRRLKNRIEVICCPSPAARKITQAYNDVSV